MTGLAPRPRCSRDGCKAWRLNDAVRECVAHAQPDERRFALQRAHAERDLRLLERTDFGPDLMTDVTTTAPRDGAGAPVLHRLSLNGANVTAGASFAEMTLVRATLPAQRSRGARTFGKQRLRVAPVSRKLDSQRGQISTKPS